MTGCEGYVESAAIGLLAGRFAAAEVLGRRTRCRRLRPPHSAPCSATSPADTSLSDDEPGKRSFQPMNVNFGLFPPVEVPKTEGKRLRGAEKAQAQKQRDDGAGADADAVMA